MITLTTLITFRNKNKLSYLSLCQRVQQALSDGRCIWIPDSGFAIGVAVGRAGMKLSIFQLSNVNRGIHRSQIIKSTKATNNVGVERLSFICTKIVHSKLLKFQVCLFELSPTLEWDAQMMKPFLSLPSALYFSRFSSRRSLSKHSRFSWQTVGM